MDCLAVQLRESGHEFTPEEKVEIRWRIARHLARYYLPGKVEEIPENPDCVMVTTGGNLGGAILSSPLVEAVRERFPGAHLIVVSNTQVGREFMEFFGVGDSFYTIDAHSLQSFGKFRDYSSAVMQITRKKPEILISNHNDQIHKLLLPFRIPVRVGHCGSNLIGYPLVWSSIFNVPVPIASDMNWLETYRVLAGRIGARPPGLPSVSVPEDLGGWAGRTLAQLGLRENERGVAVQIGVWQPQEWKQWSLEKLAGLCRNLWNAYRLRPVLLGDGSGLGALRRFEASASGLPFISLVGSTSVAQAAAILSRCRVSICNDSGLMHLSAAVGTPTVAVYGMTDPEKTWCYSMPHRFVRREDCLPCYNLDYKMIPYCEHKKCLTQLGIDQVQRAVLEVCASVQVLAEIL